MALDGEPDSLPGEFHVFVEDAASTKESSSQTTLSLKWLPGKLVNHSDTDFSVSVRISMN